MLALFRKFTLYNIFISQKMFTVCVYVCFVYRKIKEYKKLTTMLSLRGREQSVPQIFCDTRIVFL